MVGWTSMTETYRFKLGDFTCIAINDGNIDNITVEAFFSGAEPDALQAGRTQYGLTRRTLLIPVTILYVDTGAHRVLIDTGGGEGSHPENGRLIEGLRAEGIAPEDITVAALSHGHWDHICGCMNADGSLAFPNARHVMLRAEYEHWADPQSTSMVARTLEGIRGQLDLIEPDTEIVPGVQAIHTPGHTVGHTSFVVTSGREKLYCLIDTVDHMLHFEHIDWTPNWDELPAQSASTRRELFGRISREGALVHGFHLPFPGMGHLTEPGPDCWRYEPVGKVG